MFGELLRVRTGQGRGAEVGPDVACIGGDLTVGAVMQEEHTCFCGVLVFAVALLPAGGGEDVEVEALVGVVYGEFEFAAEVVDFEFVFGGYFRAETTVPGAAIQAGKESFESCDEIGPEVNGVAEAGLLEVKGFGYLGSQGKGQGSLHPSRLL